jgi:hypothetical protein
MIAGRMKKSGLLKPGGSLGLGLVIMAITMFSAPRPAYACFFPICWNATCIVIDQLENQFMDTVEEAATQAYLGTVAPIPPQPGGQAGAPPGSVLYDFEGWMIENYFDNYIGAALENMSQQFTNDIMQQTLAIGAFFDAKNQLETQLLYQQLAAKAHKDYEPSFGMCVFGTAMRSIGAADFNSQQATFYLSRHQQMREMENANTQAAEGIESDRTSRLQEFKDRFCSTTDNDHVEGQATTGFGMVCNAGKPTALTMNNDIDYLRTVLLPRTLNADFSDTTLTGDEEDVLAMSNNLYSHDLFDNISNLLGYEKTNQLAYMEVRSVVAKRSVAEAPFDALVGMKVLGPKDSSPTGAVKTAAYMGILLDELGMPKTEIPIWLGDRPSYMAQLEMVAKKIYQRPEFYTELYESPANVKRRSVAMQAIGTMMDRDIYNSYIRSEAVMSVLLETKLIPMQQEVGNKMGHLKPDTP